MTYTRSEPASVARGARQIVDWFLTGQPNIRSAVGVTQTCADAGDPERQDLLETIRRTLADDGDADWGTCLRLAGHLGSELCATSQTVH